MLTNLRYGLVDVNPASDRVDLQVLWLLLRHGVQDGRVGAEVIVVSRHAQEAGPDQSVFS